MRPRIYPSGLETNYVSKKYSDGYVIDAAPSCSAEARERDRLKADIYNKVRKAAEVHRCASTTETHRPRLRAMTA
jgi:hypothetical protein